VGDRFCKLLDAHAISASWFVRQDAPGALLGSIRAMLTRQDLLPRPSNKGLRRPSAPLAARTHALADIESELETFLTGSNGRGGLSREWVPSALRLLSFRGALERAIRNDAVCHVHIRVAELGHRPKIIRLFEDLLFRVAEERRSRRLRIVTVSDARRTVASERLTQAA
jgi:hypothetical protein